MTRIIWHYQVQLRDDLWLLEKDLYDAYPFSNSA